MTDPENFRRWICIAVDVEAYSKRLESEHRALQHNLTSIVNAAATCSRLPIAHWSVQPQGDGQLMLAPLDEHEPRYVDEFVRHLEVELSRHNRNLVSEARIRVRIALHHGKAAIAANGFAGDAPVLACRLRDAKITRGVLADSDADLVVVLSTDMYGDNVRSEHTTFTPDEFTEVMIDEDKVSTMAWLWLPRGHHSESLRQARARKSVLPGSRRGAPLIEQRAQTINNVEKVEAETVTFGTVISASWAGGDG